MEPVIQSQLQEMELSKMRRDNFHSKIGNDDNEQALSLWRGVKTERETWFMYIKFYIQIFV